MIHLGMRVPGLTFDTHYVGWGGVWRVGPSHEPGTRRIAHAYSEILKHATAAGTGTGTGTESLRELRSWPCSNALRSPSRWSAEPKRLTPPRAVLRELVPLVSVDPELSQPLAERAAVQES